MSVRHADLARFFSHLLPNEELLYHSPLPLHRPYDPSTTRFTAQKLIVRYENAIVNASVSYESISSP